jgi:hypothetical protein
MIIILEFLTVKKIESTKVNTTKNAAWNGLRFTNSNYYL